MESESEKGHRLSLTKKQLHEEKGAALLSLLSEIVADGVLKDEEILQLQKWLEEHHDDSLPAISYLSNIVRDSISNGMISDVNRLELQLGIEKVLPVTERHIAQLAREHSGHGNDKEQESRITREDLKKLAADSKGLSAFEKVRSWRDDPMTEPQYHFIRSLGSSISRSASKGQASDLITSLLGKKPISSRQEMVMRFWGRKRGNEEGPREIIEWVDKYYAEDPDRKRAWELFKEESEDDGLQGDPTRVPIGLGPQYLARIKQGGLASSPKFNPVRVRRQKPFITTFWILGALCVLVALIISGRVNRNTNTTEPSLSPSIAKPPIDTRATPVTSVFNHEDSKEVVPKLSPKETQLYAMRHAIANLKIGGIFGGQSKRVIVDNRVCRIGDVIDQGLGIAVSQIDTEKGSVSFVDSSGNVITRILE